MPTSPPTMTDPLAPRDLEQLHRSHYADLVRLAAILLDDVGECEEVVQEAFARMLSTRSSPADGKEPAYLRSAVLNGARSRMRHRQVSRRHLDSAATGSASAISADDTAVGDAAVDRVEMQRVLDAVRALPRRQAEVLLLRYHDDLSETEIADTLAISPGSVKTHASRGIASLRTTLQEQP